MDWFSLQIHNSKNYQEFTAEDISADLRAVIGPNKAELILQNTGTLLLKARLHVPSTAPFFVSGTFDLFNVTCKQHHRTVLGRFTYTLRQDLLRNA